MRGRGDELLTRPLLLLAAVGLLGACESRAPRDSEEDMAERGARMPLRGIVVLRDVSPTFRACGDDAPRALADSTGDVLRDAVDVLGGPGQPVYVEGVGRLSGTAEPSATLVELRRAAPLGESSGCDERTTPALVVARGNEPFWHVTVLPDRIVFREPEAPDGIEFVGVAPVQHGDRVVYRSSRDGSTPAAIELRLEDRGCTDSMSGEYLHLTATVRVDGRAMSGCAYEPVPHGKPS